MPPTHMQTAGDPAMLAGFVVAYLKDKGEHP